jgi:hypothetical protein
MEEVAPVALDLRDQQRKVIRFELVRSKYFGGSTVEIVLFSPRRFPPSNCLVACEPSIVIDKISVAVDLVVLVDVSVIVFASLEDDGLEFVGFGEVEVVEGND